MIVVALFAALMTVGAYIKVPMWPVPATMQFMFSVMAGLMLGAKLGALSQVVYLLIGLIGVPVFSGGGSGIGYVAQPSFGFLIGFAVAAYIIGAIYEKRKSLLGAGLASVAGLVGMYAVGLPYMYVVVNHIMGSDMTVWSTIFSGMLIFLPGDVIKIVAAVAIAPKVAERVGLASAKRQAA